MDMISWTSTLKIINHRRIIISFRTSITLIILWKSMDCINKLNNLLAISSNSNKPLRTLMSLITYMSIQLQLLSLLNIAFKKKNELTMINLRNSTRKKHNYLKWVISIRCYLKWNLNLSVKKNSDKSSNSMINVNSKERIIKLWLKLIFMVEAISKFSLRSLTRKNAEITTKTSVDTLLDKWWEALSQRNTNPLCCLDSAKTT